MLIKGCEYSFIQNGNKAILKGWGQGSVEMRALGARGGEYCKRKKSSSSTIGI